MRVAEANRPGQRSGRSWRIRHPMEQAGTMGKRRAVPVHDRSPLDPIFGSGSKIAALNYAILGGIPRKAMPAPVAIAATICSLRR